MMGSKARTFSPIDRLTLEELVPSDHFYRHVERSLDLSFVRELVADCYAPTGRPSMDPVVFFKLQLVLVFEGLRSERQLLTHAADRLSVRGFLGYDLDEPLPDHSSLTRIRDCYGIDVFRRFFETVNERCSAAGLGWGQELYLDATQVTANASLDSLAPRFADEAHLTTLIPPAERVAGTQPDGSERLRVDSPAAVGANLEQTNAERHDWIAHLGRANRAIKRGSYQRRSDYEASTTDPDAALLAHKGGGLGMGYHDHYVLDGGNVRVIPGARCLPVSGRSRAAATHGQVHRRSRRLSR